MPMSCHRLCGVKEKIAEGKVQQVPGVRRIKRREIR